jgi:hypothetical protein
MIAKMELDKSKNEEQPCFAASPFVVIICPPVLLIIILCPHLVS